MHNDFTKLQEEVCASFLDIKSFPCFIHSDLFKIGLPVRKKIKKNDLCLIYENALIDTCEKGFIIPTFNYEFGRSGVFDVTNSKSDVGILSDYFRRKYVSKRTLDPLFSAVTVNYSYKGGEDENLFGEKSIFGSVKNSDGYICFLGAAFNTNTFIHHVEEINNIGYRYIKKFNGEVIDADGNKNNTCVDYRVRPLIESSCEYRWDFLENELVEQSLLKEKNICNGKLLYYNAKKVFDFWSEKIKNDELYLLSDQYREVIVRLYEKYGKPLMINNVEGV